MATSMSSDLHKFVKKRTNIKSSVELIIKCLGSFNALTQSTGQVSTRFSKLNDFMDSLNVVQNTIKELDQGHDEDDERLFFEKVYYSLK